MEAGDRKPETGIYDGSVTSIHIATQNTQRPYDCFFFSADSVAEQSCHLYPRNTSVRIRSSATSIVAKTFFIASTIAGGPETI